MSVSASASPAPRSLRRRGAWHQQAAYWPSDCVSYPDAEGYRCLWAARERIEPEGGPPGADARWVLVLRSTSKRARLAAP